MSVAELQDTTPIEFTELSNQYLVKRDLENSRFGQICAVLANLKRDPEVRSEAFTAFDFFPQLSQTEPPLEEHENDELNRGIILDAFYYDIKARTRIKRHKVIN